MIQITRTFVMGFCCANSEAMRNLSLLGAGTSWCTTISVQQREAFWKKLVLPWWEDTSMKREVYYTNFKHYSTEEFSSLHSQAALSKAGLQPGIAAGPCRASCQPGVDCGAGLKDFGRVAREKLNSEVRYLNKCSEVEALRETVAALDLRVQQGCDHDHSLFYQILKRCMAHKDLVLGRRVHALSIKTGHDKNPYLANHIICMYACHGSLEEAMDAFTKVISPNKYMWASIILVHARHGHPMQAIELYWQMRRLSVKPDNCVFVAVLKACATAGDLASGKVVHADILDSLDEPDMFVGNSLVHMYAKCGSIGDARRVFDSLQDKDVVTSTAMITGYLRCGNLGEARRMFNGLPIKTVVTWNSMIRGYAQHGVGLEALLLYARMKQEGITAANNVTFICLLDACASSGALHQGKQLHAEIQDRGMAGDLVLGNCLVSMYAKCGSLEDARRVFNNLPSKNVVTWTAMIAGYGQHGLGQEALALYASMQQEGITLANDVTFVCLLQACASAQALCQGRQLHTQIQERELEGDVVVGTCLVDMYSKCASLKDARNVFDKMPARDAVTWNAMIAGYCHHGHTQEALTLYGAMCHEGITPVAATFVWLLQACGCAAALEKGREIHAEILHVHLDVTDSFVASTLIDMYAKCGSMFDAQQVFNALPKRDVVIWNAFIAGYARQGESQLVFDMFDRMRHAGIQPDDISFLSLLTVCSHAGLPDKCQKYFEAMSKDYGITPSIEHFTCMMDVLGRAGHVDKAMDILSTMPCPPDGVVWRSMLGACQKWSNLELGMKAFEFAVGLDKDDSTLYVLMSNICGAANMWQDADGIQEWRVKSGAWKKPGHSWWTDRSGMMHTFVVGDQEHPERQHLYANFGDLSIKVKDEEK